MKPSEIRSEVNEARKNPRSTAIITFFLIFFAIFSFYFNKCLIQNECTECKNIIYNTGKGEVCGVERYKSKEATPCPAHTYKSCRSGPGCGWKDLGGINIGKVRANTCRSPACGVESYKSCAHENFGVESYKSCAHSEFGIAGCGDPPLWKFWLWSVFN